MQNNKEVERVYESINEPMLRKRELFGIVLSLKSSKMIFESQHPGTKNLECKVTLLTIRTPYCDVEAEYPDKIKGRIKNQEIKYTREHRCWVESKGKRQTWDYRLTIFDGILHTQTINKLITLPPANG